MKPEDHYHFSKGASLWGSPLPYLSEVRGKGGETVRSLVEPSAWWTQDRIAKLYAWTGQCATELSRILVGDDALLRELTIRAEVRLVARAEGATFAQVVAAVKRVPPEIADLAAAEALAKLPKFRRARDYLVSIAQPEQGQTVIDWAVLRPDVLLRLADAGYLSEPPAGLVPREAEVAA